MNPRKIFLTTAVVTACLFPLLTLAADSSGSGMTIQNTSSKPVYIDWTFNTPSGPTACSAYSTTTNPMLTYVQVKSKTLTACHLLYTLKPGESVKQSVALPFITGKSAQFAMCSKTVLDKKNNTHDYYCDTTATVSGTTVTTNPDALCLSPNQHTPAYTSQLTGVPLPCTDLSTGAYTSCSNPNTTQPFENYHGGKYPTADLEIPGSDMLNSNYGITVNPDQSCSMNLNLSQYRFDLEPLPVLSQRLNAGKTFKPASPIISLRALFSDNAATQAKATYDAKFFITVGTGDQTKQVKMNDSSGPDTQNPLGLAYGDTDSNSANFYSLYTSKALADNSSYCTNGVCQVNICGCSPSVSAFKATLPGNQGGICTNPTGPYGGTTSCTPPAGMSTPGVTPTTPSKTTTCTSNFSDGTCATWVAPNNGPVGSAFRFSIYKGVYAKTTTAIYQDNIAAGPSGSKTYLTVPMAQAGGTVNLSNYFSGIQSGDTITYSVVNNADAIPYRNSGDANSATISTNGGTGWGPAVLQYDKPAINLSANTSGADSFPGLSIDGNTLTVKPADLKAASTLPTDKIIQLTVKADDTSNGTAAYQTFYLNISDSNLVNQVLSPNYTLLPTTVSAWVYGANMASDVVNLKPTPSSASTGASCNPAAGDYPNCSYLPAINNGTTGSSTTKSQVNIITPDMGWLQFGGAQSTYAYWNPNALQSYHGLYNNLYAGTDASGEVDTQNQLNNWQNSQISKATQYYNKFAPLTKVVETMEFDAPVKGFLPNIQIFSDKSTDISQMQYLVNSITYGIMKQDSTNATTHISGLQFDVEPLPTDPKSLNFFKRVSDRLARTGQINEIFAFANSATPPVIMAQGPLGIFLPSTYDVGQTVDNSYYKTGTYQASFGQYPAGAVPGFINMSGCSNYPAAFNNGGTASSSCPISTVDWACHASAELNNSGAMVYNEPFVTKSWCNLDLNNTLMTNAQRFGIYDARNPDNANLNFASSFREYGGHFQLALPSEGSATNWTYALITTPRVSNGSGGTCTLPAKNSKDAYNPCVIPGVPTTYKATYIPYGNAVDASDAASTNAPNVPGIATYEAATKAAGDTFPPVAGNYYVYYNASTSAEASDSTTPPCSMDNNDVSGGTTTMCTAIVVSANQNIENDPTIGTGVQTNQSSYVNSLLNFAKGTLPGATRYGNGKNPILGTPNGTNNANANPNNVGLALYALSTEEVYGCTGTGSHAGVPNCIEQFPISTTYPDTANSTVWKQVNDYVSGAVPPSFPLTMSDPNSVSSSNINGLHGPGLLLSWTILGSYTGTVGTQISLAGSIPFTHTWDNTRAPGGNSTITTAGHIYNHEATAGDILTFTAVAVSGNCMADNSCKALSKPGTCTFKLLANQKLVCHQ